MKLLIAVVSFCMVGATTAPVTVSGWTYGDLSKVDAKLSNFEYDEQGKLNIDSIKDMFTAGAIGTASAAVKAANGISDKRVLTLKEMYALHPKSAAQVPSEHANIDVGVFAFIPHLAYNFKPFTTKATWNTPCGNGNTGSITSWTNKSVTLQVQLAPNLHPLCKKQLFIITGLGKDTFSSFLFINHTAPFTYTYTWNDAEQNKATAAAGLLLYYFPTGGLEGLIESVTRTVKLVENELLEKNWQNSTVTFLNSISRNWAGFAERDPADSVPIIMDDNDIPDGTHLVIYRLDGQEGIADWAVGSESGHHVIAFRDPSDHQLYVYESTDSMPGADPYWPKPYGVCRRPWKTWMQEAVHAKYNVIILPLQDQYRAKFDNTKAQAFYEVNQGLPYGYHEYLWEWVDDGNSNIPWKPNDHGESLALIFEGMQNYMGNTSKVGAWSMLLMAVNNRLGTHYGTMSEMFLDFIATGQKDVYQHMLDAVSMPEQDTYTYWNNESVCNMTVRKDCTGRSMICEVFVFSTLKHAGVFGDLDFQAAEVDPRSAYQAAIWNTSYVWPDERCASQMKGGKKFCQIIGNWSTPLAGVSSVPVTPHFAEKCQDTPPNYSRLPAGC